MPLALYKKGNLNFTQNLLEKLLSSKSVNFLRCSLLGILFFFFKWRRCCRVKETPAQALSLERAPGVLTQQVHGGGQDPDSLSSSIINKRLQGKAQTDPAAQPVPPPPSSPGKVIPLPHPNPVSTAASRSLWVVASSHRFCPPRPAANDLDCNPDFLPSGPSDNKLEGPCTPLRVEFRPQPHSHLLPGCSEGCKPGPPAPAEGQSGLCTLLCSPDSPLSLLPCQAGAIPSQGGQADLQLILIPKAPPGTFPSCPTWEESYPPPPPPPTLEPVGSNPTVLRGHQAHQHLTLMTTLASLAPPLPLNKGSHLCLQSLASPVSRTSRLEHS